MKTTSSSWVESLRLAVRTDDMQGVEHALIGLGVVSDSIWIGSGTATAVATETYQFPEMEIAVLESWRQQLRLGIQNRDLIRVEEAILALGIGDWPRFWNDGDETPTESGLWEQLYEIEERIEFREIDVAELKERAKSEKHRGVKESLTRSIARLENEIRNLRNEKRTKRNALRKIGVGP